MELGSTREHRTIIIILGVELTRAAMPTARTREQTGVWELGHIWPFRGELGRVGYRLWACHLQSPAWNWGSDHGPQG